MFKAILNTLDDLVVFLFILSALFLLGCNNVTIEERVAYEDGTPVRAAKVYQWVDEVYAGYTYTDENGTWALTVPADTVINLCIENPRYGNKEACYEYDILITPNAESGENQMKRIDE